MPSQDQNLVKFGDLKNYARFLMGGRDKYIKIPEMEIHGHDWDFFINCIQEDEPGDCFCPSQHITKLVDDSQWVDDNWEGKK